MDDTGSYTVSAGAWPVADQIIVNIDGSAKQVRQFAFGGKQTQPRDLPSDLQKHRIRKLLLT